MTDVIVTDCDHGDVAIETEVLGRVGLRIGRHQVRDEDGVIRVSAGASALITQYAPVTRRVIESLPSLHVVARYGAGVDTIDVAAAAERGIAVVRVPDYAVEEVSDHALALMLALTRGVVVADRAVRAGRWSLGDVQHLRRHSHLVLGLLGVGRIGALVARKAQAFGFTVVAHDPISVPPGVRAVDFDELLEVSDVLSLHVPLTADTRHMVDAAALARTKPGAILINTARGGVVDQEALVNALTSGHLGGAALDVLADEPLPDDDPLRSAPNVVLTPHIGFYSQESLAELKRRVAEGVVGVLMEGRR